jgi:hypothetical protein
MRNNAGIKFPSILKSFLVCVIVKILFRTNISDTKPENNIFSHRAI